MGVGTAIGNNFVKYGYFLSLFILVMHHFSHFELYELYFRPISFRVHKVQAKNKVYKVRTSQLWMRR